MAHLAKMVWDNTILTLNTYDESVPSLCAEHSFLWQ